MGRLFAVEIIYRGIFQKNLAKNISRAIVLAAHHEGKPGISFGRYGDSPERNGIPAKSFAIVATDDIMLEEGMAKYEPKEVDITIAVDDTLCKGVESWAWYGLQPVPCPGFHPFAERVVHGDGDVNFLGLVLCHSLFEHNVVGGDDRKALGGNPVALGAVAVTPEGDPRLPLVVRRQNDGTADVFGEGFLEDTPVDDFHCKKSAHSELLPATFSSTQSVPPLEYDGAWLAPRPKHFDRRSP